MGLIHVATNDYFDSEIVRLQGQNHYSAYLQERQLEWVEEFLEGGRPIEATPRLNCIYAFDSLENAGYYADWLGMPGIKYYEVTMKNPWKAPMVICKFITQHHSKSEIIQRGVDEYWNPRLEWQFFEYMQLQMQVIRRLPAPNIMTKLLGRKRYEHDIALMDTLTIS